jgi:hypothetical protein
MLNVRGDYWWWLITQQVVDDFIKDDVVVQILARIREKSAVVIVAPVAHLLHEEIQVNLYLSIFCVYSLQAPQQDRVGTK